MDQIELACPYCAGRFQAEARNEGRITECPDCGRSVTVPAASRKSVPPAPPGAVSPAVSQASARSTFDFVEPKKILVNRQGEPVQLRRLSPEEQIRFRRRLNWGLALAGMAILAVALLVLLRLRP